MWVYAQRTGNMWHQSPDGVQTLLARGYSGNGAGENNPAMQCILDTGPLPQNTYTIAAPVLFNGMSECLRLTPLLPEQMCGRRGFWIHDGHFNSPHGVTSEGCICLLVQDRRVIANSGEDQLRVQADDPGFAVAANLPPAAVVDG